MRYILILSSFLLTATCSPVEKCFSPKYDSVSNGNGKHVDDKTNLVESEHSTKTANRLRRSMWTDILGHVAAAAEKFRMEPALAEGVNDVEGFNRNLKSKLSERSKSANALLSVGTQDASKLTKEEKEELSDELENTYIYEHEDIVSKERKLIKKLAEFDWDDIGVDELSHLYMEFLCDDKSMNIVKKIISKYPKAKPVLVEGLAKIKKKRRDQVNDDDDMYKKIRFLDSVDELTLGINLLTNRKKFLEFREKNLKWLKFPVDPEFIKKDND